jgi:hypothetical protein
MKSELRCARLKVMSFELDEERDNIVYTYGPTNENRTVPFKVTETVGGSKKVPLAPTSTFNRD